MKCAIYIRTIKSAQGTERVSANIALGLADRGHSVDFLLEECDGWLVERLAEHPNINVINLSEVRGPLLLHRGLQLRVLLRNLLSSLPGGGGDSCSGRLLRMMTHEDPPLLALLRYIRGDQPVSVMSFLNYQNLALLLVAPLAGTDTRYVVNVRNHITTSAKYGKSKWMRSVPRVMRRFFPRADLILAPSRDVAEDARQITGLSPERFRVIYNPVFRPEIIELSRELPSHPWLEEPGVPVIIAAGKLKPQKDFETLLRSFALVRQQREARLIILGRGPGEHDLMALASQLGISEDFQLPGHVKNPYAWFSRAAVFVLSSAWEGLPNVLIEAMACGCPVISTDCPGGSSEILEEGRIGRLVPVGDADAMARAIAETLDSPAPSETLLARARVFSYDKVISEYENILMAS
jgi:glycosyltransferase involved in cell wall biosynthesis